MILLPGSHKKKIFPSPMKMLQKAWFDLSDENLIIGDQEKSFLFKVNFRSLAIELNLEKKLLVKNKIKIFWKSAFAYKLT